MTEASLHLNIIRDYTVSLVLEPLFSFDKFSVITRLYSISAPVFTIELHISLVKRLGVTKKRDGFKEDTGRS